MQDRRATLVALAREQARLADARAGARLLVDQRFCRLLGRGASPALATLGDPGAPAIWSALADWDDLDQDTAIHPGSIVWPVLGRLVARSDVSGRRMLEAAAAGYGVMGALGACLGESHRASFHATATTGTVGAAVAAGVLLGYDDARLSEAVGHALSVMGGSSGAVVEWSPSMAFHRASAAQAGVAGALAAGAGLAATTGDLDRRVGPLLGATWPPEVSGSVLGRVTIRTWMTSGLTQAVAAAADAAADGFAGVPTSLDIRLPRYTAVPFVRPPSRWRDPRWAAATAVRRRLSAGDVDAGRLAAAATVEVHDGHETMVTVRDPEARSAVGSVAGAEATPAVARLAEKWQSPVGKVESLLAAVGEGLSDSASGSAARLPITIDRVLSGVRVPSDMHDIGPASLVAAGAQAKRGRGPG